MKKLVALLAFLAFLVLLWFANSRHQACCEAYAASQKVIPEKTVAKTEKNAPLMYQWESQNPITNADWDAQKKGVIAQMQDGKILRIVGPYFSDERNISTFDNMGLARAAKVKALFAADMDTSKVIIASKVIDYYEDAKTSKFEKTTFAWITQNDNVKEDETGKALIYFPHGSSKEIKNTNILNYVKSIAEKAKKSGKTVFVTGFTDNTGNATKNKALGLRRANSIKQLLIKYGLTADKINTASQGIANPIASNETAEGRAKNRRVEIELK